MCHFQILKILKSEFFPDPVNLKMKLNLRVHPAVIGLCVHAKNITINLIEKLIS